MWYIAGACAVVVLSAVAGFAKGKTETDAELKSINPLDALSSSAIAKVIPQQLLTLSPAQINILLARLEAEEAPEVTMGAMCYDSIGPPEVAEYVCPVCQEKTFYNFSQSSFIEWELAGCRRMAESINEHTEFEVSLDERLFCDFCLPSTENENQSLVLRVLRDDEVEILNKVSITDLRMLDSFLQGNLYYMDEYEAQYPIKEFSDRMRELLGVEAEQIGQIDFGGFTLHPKVNQLKE